MRAESSMNWERDLPLERLKTFMLFSSNTDIFILEAFGFVHNLRPLRLFLVGS